MSDAPHSLLPADIHEPYIGLKPYTEAETMNHGWCWRIAVEGVDHRGYVCSSAFVSEADAIAEMRAKNPGMGDTWTVRFRSGRHADFWKGNVIAIGVKYRDPIITDPTKWATAESLMKPVFEGRVDMKAVRAEHSRLPLNRMRAGQVLSDDFAPVEFLDALKANNADEPRAKK